MTYRPVAILVMACLASAAIAERERTADREIAVDCQTAGYDLILINTGRSALAAGVELVWTVRFARAEGVHLLDRTLGPGQRVVIVAATDPSYLTTDTPCTVDVRQGAN